MKNSVSTLEYALLGLLRPKAKSGYDLRKVFTETAMRQYSDSPGSIYPALRRLQAKGLIEPGPPVSKDRRGREEFHLTHAGVDTLIEWLSRTVAPDDVVLRLKELMLRFAFMDGNVPRATAIHFLEQFEQHFAVYAAGLRAKFERDSCHMPIHTGMLAFQFGIESMETQLAWVRQARTRLIEDVR